MIIWPVPYFYMGGIGQYARTPVMSFFTGKDITLPALFIMFSGGFLLAMAREIKNRRRLPKKRHPKTTDMETEHSSRHEDT